jgi:hypothetical protein
VSDDITATVTVQDAAISAVPEPRWSTVILLIGIAIGVALATMGLPAARDVIDAIGKKREPPLAPRQNKALYRALELGPQKDSNQELVEALVRRHDHPV